MAHHDEYNTFGRLDELDDYKVADGYPDIRGWDVYTDAGQKIGKVDELIVDTTEMRVLYIDVDLDGSIRDEVGDAADAVQEAMTPRSDRVERGHTLLPIGTARLDDDKDQVIIDRIDLGTIGSLPRYEGKRVTREYEASLRNHFGAGAGALGAAGTTALSTSPGAADDRAAEMRRGEEMARWYESEHYDDQRLFASRRNRMLGDRSDTDRLDDTGIGDQEIRMQLSREEAVVEKRAVPREEIIVRRNAVTTDKTVEADLRRERIDVDRAGDAGITGTDRLER